MPNKLIGKTATVLVDDRCGGPRPDKPRWAARPRTSAVKAFQDLGPVAEAFLVGAAAAGVTRLSTEIGDILTLAAAHGSEPLWSRSAGGSRPTSARSSPLRCRTDPTPSRASAGADPAQGAGQVA